jgi:hypothetical protein
MGIPVGFAWDGLRAGARWPWRLAARLLPLRVAWRARGAAPRRVTGPPPSAVVMGRVGDAAGLPVVAVALKDGGDVLGADAMKVQVKAAGTFTRGCRG